MNSNTMGDTTWIYRIKGQIYKDKKICHDFRRQYIPLNFTY